ncbi:MAG: small ribosomal subunit Rsm22 family protein [Bdellovibrionota bacterium]
MSYQDIERNLFVHVSDLMQWDCRTIESLPKDLRKSLRKRIEQISDDFTAHRKALLGNYLIDPIDIAAYAMYFHSSSIHRMLHVLERVPAKLSDLPTQLSILDVGAGTGAASEAFLIFLSRMRKKRLPVFHLLDQSSAALAFAKEHLTRTSLMPIGVKTKTVDVQNIAPIQQSYDVYLFSNVINELSDLALGNILKGMKQHAWIVMVEPALKETAQKLMQYKSTLTDLGLHIWAPCTHNLVCPMLKNTNDWCHFEAPWEMGDFRKSMDQALGHHSEALKYAYLLAGQHKINEPRKRVLSPKLKTKIKKVLAMYVCDQKEIGYYYFDKKNRQMADVQKGDLIQLTQVSDYPEAQRYYPNTKSYWVKDEV